MENDNSPNILKELINKPEAFLLLIEKNMNNNAIVGCIDNKGQELEFSSVLKALDEPISGLSDFYFLVSNSIFEFDDILPNKEDEQYQYPAYIALSILDITVSNIFSHKNKWIETSEKKDGLVLNIDKLDLGFSIMRHSLYSSLKKAVFNDDEEKLKNSLRKLKVNKKYLKTVVPKETMSQ